MVVGRCQDYAEKILPKNNYGKTAQHFSQHSLEQFYTEKQLLQKCLTLFTTELRESSHRKTIIAKHCLTLFTTEFRENSHRKTIMAKLRYIYIT